MRAGGTLVSRRTLLAAALMGAGLLLVSPTEVHGGTLYLVENVTRLGSTRWKSNVWRPRARAKQFARRFWIGPD
jgi:hypothetical protein